MPCPCTLCSKLVCHAPHAPPPSLLHVAREYAPHLVRPQPRQQLYKRRCGTAFRGRHLAPVTCRVGEGVWWLNKNCSAGKQHIRSCRYTHHHPGPHSQLNRHSLNTRHLSLLFLPCSPGSSGSFSHRRPWPCTLCSRSSWSDAAASAVAAAAWQRSRPQEDSAAAARWTAARRVWRAQRWKACSQGGA
jgi:hypothetical protein